MTATIGKSARLFVGDDEIGKIEYEHFESEQEKEIRRMAAAALATMPFSFTVPGTFHSSTGSTGRRSKPKSASPRRTKAKAARKARKINRRRRKK